MPGSIHTPLLCVAAHLLAKDYPEGAIRQRGREYRLGRLARPKEVAEAVLSLAGARVAYLVHGGLNDWFPDRRSDLNISSNFFAKPNSAA